VAASSEASLFASSFEADAELDDDQVFAAVYASVAEAGDGNE
jgi:hypothetical protein